MRLLIAACVAFFALASSAYASDVWVNGYLRSNGTYVLGHYRSAPDGNPFNTYSTYPNINPYTLQLGTVRPSSFVNPYSSIVVTNETTNFVFTNPYSTPVFINYARPTLIYGLGRAGSDRPRNSAFGVGLSSTFDADGDEE